MPYLKSVAINASETKRKLKIFEKVAKWVILIQHVNLICYFDDEATAGLRLTLAGTGGGVDATPPP